MSSPRRLLTVSALALLALGATACTSAAEPEPSATATTPSPTPEAAPFVVPDQMDGEVARAEHSVIAGTPSTSSIAVDAVTPDAPFIVEGQCQGGRVSTYRVLDANVDAGGRVLVEGAIPCDAEALHSSSFSLGHEGVVQLQLFVGEGVERAWAVVRQ